MPDKKIVKGLKQYSNTTSTQTTYQHGNKRSVDHDSYLVTSATTTSYPDVMIILSHHQHSDLIEFCPPSLQWQQEQCWCLAYNIQPRPVPYVEQHSRLSGNDLQICDVCGDGNCLFRALAFVVTGNEENHMMVCHGLVAYILQHQNSAEHYVIQESEGNSLDEDFEDQMREMENDGTWGTLAEIICAASMFETDIHMYQRRQTRTGVIREWHTYSAEMPYIQCRNASPVLFDSTQLFIVFESCWKPLYTMFQDYMQISFFVKLRNGSRNPVKLCTEYGRTLGCADRKFWGNLCISKQTVAILLHTCSDHCTLYMQEGWQRTFNRSWEVKNHPRAAQEASHLGNRQNNKWRSSYSQKICQQFRFL